MRNLARAIAEAKPIDRFLGKNWRFPFVPTHPFGRRRKLSRSVETIHIKRVVGTLSRWRQARPPILNLRAPCHAIE
jgi:hypothetical protein